MDIRSTLAFGRKRSVHSLSLTWTLLSHSAIEIFLEDIFVLPIQMTLQRLKEELKSKVGRSLWALSSVIFLTIHRSYNYSGNYKFDVHVQ